MRAFEMLPVSEKSKMLPIILLAPWLNSIKFENSHRVIAKSVGDMPILVDLDRYYQSSNPLESRVFFQSLLDPIVGPSKWMRLVEERANYIPCIQIDNVSAPAVDEQVQWARELGRGFCLRYELQRCPNAIDWNLITSVADDDVLIAIDFGYRDFSESLRADISAVLSALFEVSPNLRVTVGGSNFPNDFSEYDNFAQSEPNSSRQLYSALLGQFGNYNVFYSDWASTKPRTYDGHGSPALPRIDFPTATQWIMARSKSEGWSFEDAAERITRLTDWDSRPVIWGTGMIDRTAAGLPGGIKSHPDVIAARVNIHLFTQSNYNSPNPPTQPMGKWKDPI